MKHRKAVLSTVTASYGSNIKIILTLIISKFNKWKSVSQLNNKDQYTPEKGKDPIGCTSGHKLVNEI